MADNLGIDVSNIQVGNGNIDPLLTSGPIPFTILFVKNYFCFMFEVIILIFFVNKRN